MVDLVKKIGVCGVSLAGVFTTLLGLAYFVLGVGAGAKLRALIGLALGIVAFVCADRVSPRQPALVVVDGVLLVLQGAFWTWSLLT
jgi:hypothetical protein